MKITKFPPLQGVRRGKFILKQADAFQRASVLALDCALKEAKEQKLHLSLVYGVNAAFAVELYLKCLLLIEGGQVPETHNLKQLFNQVSRESRGKITKRHNTLAADHPVLSEFRQKLGIKTDLNSILEDGQDIFTQFRYFFEGIPNRMEPIGFGLDLFAQIVRNRILDLRPEWVSTEFPSVPNSGDDNR